MTDLQLLRPKHLSYLFSLRDDKQQEKKLSHWMGSHLRVSGIYWGLSALKLLEETCEENQQQKELSEEEQKILQFVIACQNEDGGFGGNVGHDSHLLYTLSAIQVLTMMKMEDKMKYGKDKVASFVISLQKEDGSFVGDRWGEVDTRFSYTALNCLALLGKLESPTTPEYTSLVNKTAEFVKRCQNWDGGFGVSPSAESHAGQIFCCLGALSIANKLDEIDRDRVAWWLAERQLPSGGLNGRPEKKADVCYSWWVLSSMSMLNRISWIDRDMLIKFILLCQDEDDGGISDKPGNLPDVYHTFFGTCGLSLLKWKVNGTEKLLPEIDPTFAMPPETLSRLRIAKRGMKN